MALISIPLFLTFLPIQLSCSSAQTWIKSGYWLYDSLNPYTYQLSITSTENNSFSAFTNTVKQKNPSIITLLSIGGGLANYSDYSSMVSQISYRKYFIDSAIRTARLYGFDGLDFSWVSASNESDMTNMVYFFNEWRAAIKSESQNSNNSQLLLTMSVQYSPYARSSLIESIRKNLNWVNVMAYDYYMPQWSNYTRAHSALYDPGSEQNTDYGMTAWINSGLSAEMLVLGLPFYGYAWTLENPRDNNIGAPANGQAITKDGGMSYKDIKGYIQRNGAVSLYNSTYVVNYCSVETIWIGFDDVEVVKIKVAYAKKRKLGGYSVWHVSNDDNWVLSQAAQEEEKGHENKRRLLLIILPPTAAIVIVFIAFTMWYLQSTLLFCKGYFAKWARNSGEKAFENFYTRI